MPRRSARVPSPAPDVAPKAPATRGRPRKAPTSTPATQAPTNLELAGTVNALATRMVTLESGQDDVMSALGKILQNQQAASTSSPSEQVDAPGKTPAPRGTRPTPYPRATAPTPLLTTYDNPPPIVIPGSTGPDEDLTALLTTAATGDDTYSGLPLSFRQATNPTVNEQVQSLLNSAQQMSSIKGKPSFVHEYVFRGNTRVKTALNNLDAPEYFFGIQRMLKDPRVPAKDKPAIALHLSHLITDAKEYEWQQVREWSERLFSAIHEEDLTWENERQISSMRDTIAHVHAGRRYATPEAANFALSSLPGPAPQSLLHLPLQQPTTQYASVQQLATANKYKPRVPKSSHNRTDRPCEAYNSPAGCPKADGHVEAGVQYGHHCSWCRQSLGILHLHTYHACNIKKNPNHFLRQKFQA